MLGNETEVRWFTVVFIAVSDTEFHFSWCAALPLWSLATALAAANAAFISLRMSNVSYTGLFNVFFRFTDELYHINVNSATGMFDF